MADRTKIEWADATWNPIRGCIRVSGACRNCYAEVMAARFSDPGQWGHGLARRVALPGGGTDHRWTGKVELVESALDQPLRWRKPRRIFVCSTSDPFQKSVPDAWIDRIFATMALAPQHIYLLLTKRPERAREYITGASLTLGDSERNICVAHAAQDMGIPNHAASFEAFGDPEDVNVCLSRWPLPNVWIGTSVEDQATADERIPHLLATPAAGRFISAEPLLWPVDLTRVGNVASVSDAFPELFRDIQRHMQPHRVSGVQIEAIGSQWQATTYYQTPDHMGGFEVGPRRYSSIDWVIVGGESGPGARPMHPDWVRALRDQCQAAGVAYFFKQWGALAPWDDDNWSLPDGSDDVLAHEASITIDGVEFLRVGKARAGRLLDGREWNEVPG